MSLKPTIVSQIFYLLPKYEELHSHVPSRILAVQWIGPAVLAATAIDALTQSPSRKRILRAAAVGFGVWGLAIVVLTLNHWPVSWTTLACAALTVGIIGMFSIVNTPPRERYSRFVPRAQATLAILLLLLIVADPAGGRLVRTLRTGQTMSEVIQVPTGPITRSAITENDSPTDAGGAGEFLQQRQAAGEYFRFFGYENVLQQGGDNYPSTYRENFGNPVAISILVNARAMRLQLYDTQGYNPVQLQNYVSFLNSLNGEVQNYHDAQVLPGGLNSPLLNLLNTRYIVIPNDAVGARPREDILLLVASYPEVFRNEKVRVLENPNAMPRAWLVHEVVRANPADIPALIEDDAFDPARTVILNTDAPDIAVTQPTTLDNDSVEIIDYEDDRISLRVHTDGDGVLVLSETYERGWHAVVDGESVPVEEAFGVLRAVPIPAGNHEVVLTYDPWSLRIGFYTSLFGAGLSLIVIGAFVTRRPRFGNPEDEQS